MLNKICKLLVLTILLAFVDLANAQTIYLPPLTGNNWDTIPPQQLGYCTEKIDSLYAFLNTNNTKAFILLKDGKIVLEKYFGTHTQSSPWQWASAGKTITSFIIGIAQQEGLLAITDTASKYLGTNWTSCSIVKEQKITIKHQLSMTTGLDDGVLNNHCTFDSCLVYKADAGSRWAYHNAPYTLLDKVIENATHTTLNLYTNQKLKTPTGMTGTFVKVGDDNVYFSNARSMARFGILILNNGKWGNNQILTDTSYFNQMINTSQALNKSYGYLWWLNGKSSFMLPTLQTVFNGSLSPNAPNDMIAALGKDGQFLNVVKSQNLVWVRMGNAPDNVLVPYMLNDSIWRFVNNLQCNSTGIINTNSNTTRINLYPNPCFNELNLESNEKILSIEMYSTQGELVLREDVLSNKCKIPINNLPHGIYLVKTILSNGKVFIRKIKKD